MDWALGQGTAGCHIRVNSKCFSRIECSYSRLPTYEYISKKSLRLRWNRWYSWYLTFEISGWFYVSLVSIPSRLSSYTEELWYDKTVCSYIYIYIYIYNLACLAALKSSDRTKQVCLWMTIYMFPYPCRVELSSEGSKWLPLA